MAHPFSRLRQTPRRGEREQAFRRILAHRLFRAMVARQGTDVAEQCRPSAEPALFRALRTCMDCPHTEACRLWLELENPRGDHPRFCPNARFLQACRTGSGSGGGRQASRPASAFS